MAKKSMTAVAKEVIAGKWGVGSARKAALEAAGYDYDKIQAKVNALLSEGTKDEAVTSRETSSTGINLIKSFEGLSKKACKALSTEKYYTIGYGHYGADVKKGQTITEEEALKLLIKDVRKFEKKVNKYQTKYNFSQNQFDALMSFAYNVGSIDGITANGTRSLAVISDKFLCYSYSGGNYIKGLYNRRKKEKALFDKA